MLTAGSLSSSCHRWPRHIARLLLVAAVILPASAQEDSPASARETIAEYQRQIAERERDYGVFDPELGELLLGLGLFYKNQGDYSEAADALDRALHIRKVTEGLESMNQVPVLQALIETNSAGQSWDELDKNYHTLLWIHQRRLESGNPDILPLIDLVGRWKLAAYNNNLLSAPPGKTLYDLADIYKTTIRTIESLYGDTDHRLLIPLRGLAISQYEIVNNGYSIPVHEYQSTEPRLVSRIVCRTETDATGRRRQVCESETVHNPNYIIGKQRVKDRLMQLNLDMVKDTLIRVKEVYENDDTLTVEGMAKSLLDLGDWYMINGQHRAARSHYEQAFNVLQDNQADAETMDYFFGKPVKIPALDRALPDSAPDTGKPVPAAFVKLAFQVYQDGRPGSIKVIDQSEPDNYKARKNASNYVRDSLFRPQLVAGKPVRGEAELTISGKVLE